MSQKNTKNAKTQLLLALMVTVALLLTPAAYAAAPGITGSTFNLTAQAAHISQPDGVFLYSWGYGCSDAPSGFAPDPSFGTATTGLANATCPSTYSA